MAQLDPILAVRDVNKSAAWYQSIFACTRRHAGNEFAILDGEDGEVFLCLHKWGEHDHPTMKEPSVQDGNGLILYFRTKAIQAIRANCDAIDHPVESEIQLNPNSGKKEFSLRDPDGYYWTISEYHAYGG